MKDFLLTILICPYCKGQLRLTKTHCINSEIESGTLSCSCGRQYPVRNGIPRFVETDGYVRNFSFEWNRFSKTQLDSFNKTKISENRFKEVTGLELEQLNGKMALEVGCGMGRFLEVVSKTAQEAVGIDLSFSVDAARANLKNRPNVHLIQADIFNLPLARKRFDLVYSIGVLHHTHNPKMAFLQIAPLLRESGLIAVWISPKSAFSYLPKATKVARVFCSGMNPRILLKFIQKSAPLALPFVRIPLVGRFLKGWLIPICDYKGQLPLDNDQLLEWSILDTFDLLSPRYLYPYSSEEIKEWFAEARLSDIVASSPPVIVRARQSKERVLCAA
jgi:SAM-dependent methyltransferase